MSEDNEITLDKKEPREFWICDSCFRSVVKPGKGLILHECDQYKIILAREVIDE